MTKIPHTQFYDSPFLTEVRNNGIKDGIAWMRSKVIEMLLDHPDSIDDGIYLDYIDCVNDIDLEDFSNVKRTN